MEKNCTSCGAKLVNHDSGVSFKCPNCAEVVITRCGKCRKLSVEYKCEKCGFIGP